MPITVKTHSRSVVEHAFCPLGNKLSSINNDMAIKFSHCHRCCQSPKPQESYSQKKYFQALPNQVPSSKTVLPILARSQTGFTLVEIMVVMVILSIFAGMIAVSVGSSES
ncbi:type II secretion system protein, partial [Psychrobacter sp. 1U2]